MMDAWWTSRPVSGILLRRSWSVYCVFILIPFGCMMIFFSSCISSVFSGARSSRKVTLAAESISAGVCILLGLVQRGLDIKLFTKLLVSAFIFSPAGDPHQLLGTHWSFQVAPPLVSPRFAVVLCPGFLVVHVALLWPVRILYPCDQKYPVGSHGGLSYLLGFVWFATAGVTAVRFLTSLTSFRFDAWRLAMESVKVLFIMTSFSTVPFFWTA